MSHFNKKNCKNSAVYKSLNKVYNENYENQIDKVVLKFLYLRYLESLYFLERN